MTAPIQGPAEGPDDAPNPWAAPQALGGSPVPGEHDAKGWHDLAEQRAAVEGIPFPASLSERRPWPTVAELENVADILDRHGITPEVIAEHIAAEQAAVAEGTVAPLRKRSRG